MLVDELREAIRVIVTEAQAVALIHADFDSLPPEDARKGTG